MATDIPLDRRLDELDLGGMAGRYGSYVSLSAEAALSLGSMEGMADAAAAVKRRAASDLWSGYLAAALVAAVAYLVAMPNTILATYVHADQLTPTMWAILLGVAVRNMLPLPKTISAGCKDIVHRVIPIAIVCIGAELNFADIAGVGGQTLVLTLGAVLLGFSLAYYTARFLGLNHKTSLLLGSGTAICGSSAIAATAPLIESDDEDMLLSIGTVNLVGLLAMLTLPMAALGLHLSTDQFGVWCGTSIHAVPQVIAAAGSLSNLIGAEALATLVKMGRVALLAPLVFVLAVAYARRHGHDTTSDRQAAHVRYAKLVPWFIWAFVGVALLSTLGLLPVMHFQPLGHSAGNDVEMAKLLKLVSKILLALAMAAIGLGVNLRALLSVGGRALAAGVISSILLAGCTLGLIRLFL